MDQPIIKPITSMINVIDEKTIQNHLLRFIILSDSRIFRINLFAGIFSLQLFHIIVTTFLGVKN
jgi:hypothetical protein